MCARVCAHACTCLYVFSRKLWRICLPQHKCLKSNPLYRPCLRLLPVEVWGHSVFLESWIQFHSSFLLDQCSPGRLSLCRLELSPTRCGFPPPLSCSDLVAPRAPILLSLGFLLRPGEASPLRISSTGLCERQNVAGLSMSLVNLLFDNLP